MNSIEEFDYVVLGDEPAGVWLLEKLAQGTEALPLRPRLGWLTLDSERPQIATDEATLTEFGLEAGRNWSCEVLTPKTTFRWDEPTLRERFPKVDWDDIFQRNKKAVPAAQRAIRHYPDLLGYASGLWRSLGRATQVRPENLILNAGQFRSLSWWRPGESLPGRVSRLAISETDDDALEKIQFEKDRILIFLKSQKTWIARRLILNTRQFWTQTLCDKVPELADKLDWSPSAVAPQMLLPLRMHAAPSTIPSPARPLNIWFDVAEIPDVDRDIWSFWVQPTEQHKLLTLRVANMNPISLDHLLEKFRTGLSRLNRLFPFLPKTIAKQDIPLSMETCHSGAARDDVVSHLDREGWEVSQTARLNHQSFHPRLSYISPANHCYLPYPAGPLTTARELGRQILSQEQKKKAPKRAKGASEAAPPR